MRKCVLENFCPSVSCWAMQLLLSIEQCFGIPSHPIPFSSWMLRLTSRSINILRRFQLCSQNHAGLGWAALSEEGEVSWQLHLTSAGVRLCVPSRGRQPCCSSKRWQSSAGRQPRALPTARSPACSAMGAEREPPGIDGKVIWVWFFLSGLCSGVCVWWWRGGGKGFSPSPPQFFDLFLL